MGLGTVVACLLALAPMAAASWTARQTVASGVPARVPVDVAIGSNGTAVVAWTAANGRAMAAIRNPGGDFAAPVTVSPADQIVIDGPEAAVGPSGEIMVVWQADKADGTPFGLVAAHRPAGGSFGTPFTVKSWPLHDPEVGFDAQGNATVLYGTSRPDPDSNGALGSIASRVRTAAGTWTAPQSIEIGAYHAGPVYSIESNGDAVAVVDQDDRLAAVVRAGTMSGWGSPQSLTPPGRGGDDVQLAGAHGGGTVASWYESDPQTTYAHFAVARAPGGGFGTTPTRLPDDGVPHALVAGPNGTATAACFCVDGSTDPQTSQLELSNRSSSGTWSAWTAVAEPVADRGWPTLVRDTGGGLYAAGLSLDPTTGIRSIRAVARPGTAWEPAQTISYPATTDRGLGRVAMAAGPAGEAVAAWSAYEDGTWQVQTSRHTSAPPPAPAPPRPHPTVPTPLAASVARQADAAHTGAVIGAGVRTPLEYAWSTPPLHTTYAVVGDGKVFTLLRPAAGESLVAAALDPADGDVLWRSPPLEAAGASAGAYLAYGDGRLFVALNGRVTAISTRTAEVLWSQPVAQWYAAPPIVSGDTVLVQQSGRGATTYAFHVENGRALWSLGTDGGTVTAGGGLALIANKCGRAEAAGLGTGAVAWSFYEGISCGGESYSTYDGEWLWADDRDPGRIFDVASGRLLRRFEGTAPALRGTTGYRVVGRSLVAFDLSTLAQRWSVAAPGDEEFVTLPLVVDGAVYVGTSTGKLLAFALGTGTELWRGTTGASMGLYNDRPRWGLAAGQGLVLMATPDGLTAFRSSATSPGDEPDPPPDPGPEPEPEPAVGGGDGAGTTDEPPVNFAGSTAPETGSADAPPTAADRPRAPSSTASIKLVAGQSLRNVVRRGLAIRVTCTRRCTARWRADATELRRTRIRLGQRRGTLTLPAAMSRTVRIRLTRKAVTALRRATPIRLTITLTAPDQPHARLRVVLRPR